VECEYEEYEGYVAASDDSGVRPRTNVVKGCERKWSFLGSGGAHEEGAVAYIKRDGAKEEARYCSVAE